MSLGRVIAKARKKKGLSQKELASRVLKEDGEPISPQYLNDIEHDRRSPSGNYLLGQFARVLDLSHEYLHYLVDSWPEEVRDAAGTEEEFLAAFRAFRSTLKGKGRGS